MQEQNLRLLQQLREKDDANFKLMSERIKSNQIQKLLREEKEVLQVQSGNLMQLLLLRKLFHLSLHFFICFSTLSFCPSDLRSFICLSMKLHNKPTGASSDDTFSMRSAECGRQKARRKREDLTKQFAYGGKGIGAQTTSYGVTQA